jgi:hypothetical protein
MAGMISQAKRQMTSKVVRESPEVSNFAGEKPLKTLESPSTSVQPYQTPDSRYKEEEEKNAPPPSSSFENDAVVVAQEKESGEGGPEGPKTEPRPIVISPYLAQQIKTRSGWRQ